MAMLRVCGHPGCRTLTLGDLCIEHESSPAQRAELRRVRAVPALVPVRAQQSSRGASGRSSGI
jgi:hypothetical protein